jgi:hypothetical protein
MPLFFCVCSKQSGHVDTTSDEKRLNDEGQITHYKNRDVLRLQLLVYLTVGQLKNKEMNFADTL